MVNRFNSNMSTPNSFGRKGALVTPAAADLAGNVKGVVCITSGNITVVPQGNADADVIAFVGVSAGFVPPFMVRRVTAATATVWTIED